MKKLFGIFAALIILSGCQIGSATFQGSIGGQVFQPDGTVFAWVDNNELNIAMTWVVFDPVRDLNGFTPDNKTAFIETFKKYDALKFTIADRTQIQIAKAETTSVTWVQFDARKNMAPVTNNSLGYIISKYDSNTISGTLHFQIGPSVITGDFTAPIYQAASATVPANNWKLLTQ